MPKYRKKPIVVEAIRLVSEPDKEKIHNFMADTKYYYVFKTNSREGKFTVESIVIDTLEGTMLAKIGDYIIKGVQEEIYPCKPDIFEATYEAVTDNDSNSNR